MTFSQEPEPNIPMLRKCVEWAEAEHAKGDQGLWNQGYYRTQTACGTAYCIAGYALHLEGVEWLNEVHINPHSAAADLLGLNDGQAEDLFAGSNGIKAVRRIAEEIAGERL